MSTQAIKSRFDGRTLYECEAETMLEAVQRAVKSGSNLSYSNLSGSDLSGSDLSGSDLRGSNLRGSDLSYSDLSYSNLSGSNLRGSNLSYSDLSGSDLSGSDLRGSDLRGSNLRGAKINWESRALIGEILRRAAGDDVGRRCLAGGVTISTDWCWTKMLAVMHPEKEWALGVLAPWVQDDDGAPEILRTLAKNLQTPGVTDRLANAGDEETVRGLAEQAMRQENLIPPAPAEPPAADAT